MSQAKDRTLFTITKAHIANREFERLIPARYRQDPFNNYNRLQNRRRGFRLQRFNNYHQGPRLLTYPTYFESNSSSSTSDEDAVIVARDEIDLGHTPQNSPLGSTSSPEMTRTSAAAAVATNLVFPLHRSNARDYLRSDFDEVTSQESEELP